MGAGERTFDEPELVVDYPCQPESVRTLRRERRAEGAYAGPR
jgi:hypothetical protein